MIICDITHQTEIAGSATIELRRDGQEPITVRLDLSPEALSALEAGDWVALGKLAAKAAPLNRVKRAKTAQDGPKPKQKPSTSSPTAPVAKAGSPSPKSNGKPAPKVVEGTTQSPPADKQAPKAPTASTAPQVREDKAPRPADPGPARAATLFVPEPDQPVDEAPVPLSKSQPASPPVEGPDIGPDEVGSPEDDVVATVNKVPTIEWPPGTEDDDDFDDNIF